MKLVQVTNCWGLGGTTMCALAVVRALPEWRHEILAYAPPRDDVPLPRGVTITHSPTYPITPDADVLLLHNISADRLPGLPVVPTVQFHHSEGTHAPAHVHVYASDWLRGGRDGITVYQSVDPIEPSRDHLFRVGRLTNPDPAKWGPDVDRVFARIDVRAKLDACGGRVADDRVVHHRASPTAPAELLSRWHVLLYHSPVTETFGRVVVEAMAAGCVPLVDPRGGPAETVLHGVTGFHCGSADAFVKCVRLLYNDRELWERMSAAAASHASARFSHQRFGRHLLRLFALAARRALTQRAHSLGRLRQAERRPPPGGGSCRIGVARAAPRPARGKSVPVGIHGPNR